MTNRAQSLFFFTIVFLFASGAGLLVYKNYNDYYQQKTLTDLEITQTKTVPVKIENASSTPHSQFVK